VVILAVGSELAYQPLEFLDTGLGGADRQTVLATRISAGLARIQPVLHRPGQQAIGDVPEVGVLVLVRQLVAQIHYLGKG
jgi:hypothetical protein